MEEKQTNFWNGLRVNTIDDNKPREKESASEEENNVENEILK